MTRAIFAAIVMLGSLIPAVRASEPEERPYSCRLLDDEHKKCAMNPYCDKRVIDRLSRECRRDGGQP